MVSEFVNNAEMFANQVEQMDESMMDQPFTDEKYGTYRRNIEAVIEHSYYHLGQVSQLRKIIMQQ
ncbi:MAG TPA: hypothetical protein PKY28_01295 [Ferruginibacter sp.]|nr:hypothetical protein [Ferruginibacter sp.]